MFQIKRLILFTCLLMSSAAMAQKDPLERTWFNAEQTSKIQIYKGSDGKFYGKIVWLKSPLKNNKPKLDEENPKKELRTQPILNLIILRSFIRSKDDSNEYEGGTVYDPNNGKTYCGKLTLKGNELKLRGYLCSLGSWFGRSSTWKAAE